MCDAQLKKYQRFLHAIADMKTRMELQKLLGLKDQHITMLEIENKSMKRMVSEMIRTCIKRYRKVIR